MKLTDLSDLRWSDLRKLNRDDVLQRMGLRQRTPTTDFFTGLGLFAVGILVGAGLGILFAPRPGTEMRSQLTDSLRRGARKAEDYSQQLGAETGTSIPGSH